MPEMSDECDWLELYAHTCAGLWFWTLRSQAAGNRSQTNTQMYFSSETNWMFTYFVQQRASLAYQFTLHMAKHTRAAFLFLRVTDEPKLGGNPNCSACSIGHGSELLFTMRIYLRYNAPLFHRYDGEREEIDISNRYTTWQGICGPSTEDVHTVNSFQTCCICIRSVSWRHTLQMISFIYLFLASSVEAFKTI